MESDRDIYELSLIISLDKVGKQFSTKLETCQVCSVGHG